MSTLHTMFELYGQSPWLEATAHTDADVDPLGGALGDGIRGVTSTNRSLAVALAGAGYDQFFAGVHGRGSADLAEDLVATGARASCDALEDLYRDSMEALREGRQRFGDGLVAVEMDPHLADERAATIASAARLASRVARPNVMISIPATPQGLAATIEVLGAGISVNVTLVNSVARYVEVFDAWLDGLELAASNGLDVETIASTASFALAPVDVVYDSLFAHRNDPRLGTAAVSTAAGIYRQYRKLVNGRRATTLLERGAQLQRPLWTSTAPANPAYFDLLYVNHIASFETAISLSPATVDLVLDHGECATSMLLSTRNIKRTSYLVKDLPRSFSHVAIARKLDRDELGESLRAYDALIDAVQAKVQRPHP